MDENNSQRKLELHKDLRQGYRLIDKDPQKAIIIFTKAYKGAHLLEDDKLERICAFYLGTLYIACGQPNDGVKYLCKAIPPENEKDDNSNGDVYFNLGLAYEKMASASAVTEQGTHRKTAINYYRKAAEEYKSEQNSARHIECFDNILKLQKASGSAGSVDELLEVYDDLSNLLNKQEQLNKKMAILCEKANFLRSKKKQEEAKEAAESCFHVIENVGESKDETIAHTLNELGLLYTQIQEYDKATKCFEKALPIIRNSESNQKLEAVILQNLGAAYNFVGEYQRSETFHLQAADKFAKLQNRHSQGQCFANLAFAHSQLGDNDRAWEYFILARQAAEDAGDMNTLWQVNEGLGTVQFRRHNMEKAEEHFKKALKELGNKNEEAFDRICLKLKDVHERQLHGGSFVRNSFGPQPRRGVLSRNLNQHVTAPYEPQPEDMTVRETMIQQVSEQPPVKFEKDQSVLPVERATGFPIHHQRVNRGFSYHSGELMPAHWQRAQQFSNEAYTTSSSDDSSDDSDNTGTESDEPLERREVSSRISQTKPVSRELPVHSGEGTMGSLRHKYEALLEQNEAGEVEHEEKTSSGSDTESSSSEETEGEEDENHGSGQHLDISLSAKNPDDNTYEKFQQRKHGSRHNPDSTYENMGQVSKTDQTGSGNYAEIDFSTKSSSRHAGNDDSKQKSRDISKENFLSSSSLDEGQSSEQDEAENLSPRQGSSADHSGEDVQHTPRREREKHLYQLHKQQREKEKMEKEAREKESNDGKPSKTCILM